VAAGDVGWFDVGVDGSYAYNVAPVDQVCTQAHQASCAALGDTNGRKVTLAAAPKSIITSPSKGQAIVVGADGSSGNEVFVVALPADSAIAPSASPSSASTPTPTPVPSTAAPTPTSTPTGAATSTAPSQPASTPPSPTPTPTASVTPTPVPTPTRTPAPTAAALAIVSGVTVVGDAAAFSSDGTWFAFTARPADGTAGPDIYLWRVGEAQARRVTSDHRSAFASWAGSLLVGSRPSAAAIVPAQSAVVSAAASDAPAASPEASTTDSPGTATSPGIPTSPVPGIDPVTFTIDPTTGVETALPLKAWRPAVDPTGRRAVLWNGRVAIAADGRTVSPVDGRLVLVSWAGGAGTIDPAAPSISSGPISDFTVRWDETGSWLAVWLADATDPTVGRLSLLHLDPKTGAIDRPDAGPQDVPALPGFSIENGRLAWATPPSQDGEGSRVQIVAWSATGVGSIESAPGQDVIVVH